MSLPRTWRWKRRFWTLWQRLRFKLARPQQIGAPRPNRGVLNVVPLGQIYPSIPLREVVTVERIPKDEAPLPMRVLIGAGLVLNTWIPAMRAGLPEIDEDADRALQEAGIERYAATFRSPMRPVEYPAGGPTDLGRLAVASPYAVLTQRDPDGVVQWDLRHLGAFEHHDGLCSLGVRLVFSEASGSDRLIADRIESEDLGVVRPTDPEWDRAASLAVCAATTHVSLARHFLAVHLVSGNHWDVATRNQLPVDHPVHRLVWPHVFNSFYTNYGVTRVQLLPDGDFVNMFSFTHDGLIAFFEAMYLAYDIAMGDPLADWSRRGLGDEPFDHPTQTNLVELFDVVHAHTTRYLDAYYDDDEAVRSDGAVVAWLAELDALVPNGVGDVIRSPTKDRLSRLIAGYIHEGTVIHDLVGTTLWDYQLWSDHNPVRVARDGRRVPVDVFQRVINNNFALQIRRAPLLADYGQVALDGKGAGLFTTFYEECLAQQARYDDVPAGPWRMEPKNLEINMNG